MKKAEKYWLRLQKNNERYKQKCKILILKKPLRRFETE